MRHTLRKASPALESPKSLIGRAGEALRLFRLGSAARPRTAGHDDGPHAVLEISRQRPAQRLFQKSLLFVNLQVRA